MEQPKPQTYIHKETGLECLTRLGFAQHLANQHGTTVEQEVAIMNNIMDSALSELEAEFTREFRDNNMLLDRLNAIIKEGNLDPQNEEVLRIMQTVIYRLDCALSYQYVNALVLCDYRTESGEIEKNRYLRVWKYEQQQTWSEPGDYDFNFDLITKEKAKKILSQNKQKGTTSWHQRRKKVSCG